MTIPWNKGKKTGPLTEEARKKISKGLMGNQYTKGKHLSDEHKRKVSESMKKRKNTWGWKVSLSLKGRTKYSNEYLFTNLTHFNILIRATSQYRDWRTSIFERDNYKCVLCKKGGSLNVDHIKPFSVILKEFCDSLTSSDNIMELVMGYLPLWDKKNARTLCESCHKKTDTYGFRASQYKSI